MRWLLLVPILVLMLALDWTSLVGGRRFAQYLRGLSSVYRERTISLGNMMDEGSCESQPADDDGTRRYEVTVDDFALKCLEIINNVKNNVYQQLTYDRYEYHGDPDDIYDKISRSVMPGDSYSYKSGCAYDFRRKVFYRACELLGIAPKIAVHRFLLNDKVRHILYDFDYESSYFNRDEILTCPYVERVPYNDYCDAYTYYRTIDGICNNLYYPLWGASGTPQKRAIPSDYCDGISSIRCDKYGDPLPSALFVAQEIHQEVEEENLAITYLFMTFGQLLDHDIDLSPEAMVLNNAGEEVPPNCPCRTTDYDHCANIEIPANHNFFDPADGCSMFRRSEGVSPIDCSIAPRQQLNAITSFLDANIVYGSDEERLERLRERNLDLGRGLLKTQLHPHGPHYQSLMPVTGPDGCNGVPAETKCFDLTLPDGSVEHTCIQADCFLAGDKRANAQFGLAALHTYLVREHNRIAKALCDRHPDWSDEKLFQTARAILIAEWQHIVFNEYLPLVLGPYFMRHYGLNLLDDGYYTGYDYKVDPRAENQFSTASFRFSHSNIPFFIRLSEVDYSHSYEVPLPVLFFNVTFGYEALSFDMVTAGTAEQRATHTDRFFSESVTRHLFTKDPPFGIGTSLPARNIQRGRDHGLAGYNKWLEFVGLQTLKSFDDLLMYIPDPRVVEKFRQVYKHYDDIDLYAAGVSERPVPGGMVGPTFAHLIGRQFKALRDGDRFWYENADAGFTERQLANIRQARLARIICQNSDEITEFNEWPMLMPTAGPSENDCRNLANELDDLRIYYQRFGTVHRVPCSTLIENDINFDLWD